MDRSAWFTRFAASAMLLGGVLALLINEYAVLPAVLLLCAVGVLCGVRQHSYVGPWRTVVGVICGGGALVGAFADIAASVRNPLLVTDFLRNADGVVINVIEYHLDYFTFRYGTISAVLLLGLALLCFVPTYSLMFTQRWRRVFFGLAACSVVLWLGMALGVYLDGLPPRLLMQGLWCLYGAGWITLGSRVLTWSERSASLSSLFV